MAEATAEYTVIGTRPIRPDGADKVTGRAVYGGDSFEKKKPDPAGAQIILKELDARPDEAAMVGDSDVDMQTARNAGTLAIGVNYGFGRHNAAAYPADLYVNSLEELSALAIDAG